MDDKNRFSILLEHLLEVAEVKNYTLAKRLQYDVSYISKWVSGRMLPAKKTEKRVMEGISACVVDEATDDGRDLLLREYSVCNLVRRTEKGRLRRRGWGLRWEKAQKGGKGTNLRGFFED